MNYHYNFGMNVIIPVAGEGIRLRPHTHILPKCLLSVAGKPILGHILDSFKKLKIARLVIVYGTKGEAITQFCKKYAYNFRFVHQEKRLGLGHAVYVGAKGLTGPTIVLLGDTIIDYAFTDLRNSKTNTLAVKEVSEPRRFGIVEVKDDTVVDLVEKPQTPKSNLAICGLYYFPHIEKVYRAIAHLIRKNIKTKGEYQLTDGLKYLMNQGTQFRVVKIDKWYDCGTAASLIESNRYLLQKASYFKKRPKTIILPPVYLADSATITDSIIGPYVSIGNNAIIKNSIIKDSIINNFATVENELLAESIVGEKAVVHGGFKKLNVSDSSVLESQ